MSKGSAPQAPDPYQSAAAQYQYGTEAANYNTQLNDVNTIGPTGETSYQQTPGTWNAQTGTWNAPTTTQTTSLSPAEQALLTGSQGIQLGQQGSVGNLQNQFNALDQSSEPSINPVQYSAGPSGPINTSIDTSNVPGLSSAQNYESQGQATALAGEEAAMQPMQSQEYEQLDASLRNSGAQPGTPAYDNAMAAFNAQIGQQNTQAAGAAITAGTGLQNTTYGEEANTNQQLFGEAQQEAQFGNTAQQQQYGENYQNATLNNSAGTAALADYANQLGIPLNDMEAILSNTQAQAPQAVAPTSSQVSAPDIMSAFQNQYQGQLANYNAGVSTTNSEVGDAVSIAAMAAMAY